VFTARYAFSPYIKQICFVFKGLKGEISCSFPYLVKGEIFYSYACLVKSEMSRSSVFSTASLSPSDRTLSRL
jgi:hypothetical protein